VATMRSQARLVFLAWPTTSAAWPTIAAGKATRPKSPGAAPPPNARRFGAARPAPFTA
jgi:hypothetical protein